MKRIFMLLLCAAAASGAYSQFRAGIKGGINFSNQHFKERGMRLEHSGSGDLLTGIQAGIITDWQLSKSLHFRPELQYITKGSKTKANNISLDFKPNYIELPLNLVYYHQGKGIQFYLGGGPALAVGVSGKMKVLDYEKNIFDDNNGFKRFDLGLNIVAGIDLPGGFTAGLNFNRGLLKAWDENFYNQSGAGTASASLNTQVKNYSFGLSVGYFFLNRK